MKRFYTILLLTGVFLFTTCELINDEDEEEKTPVIEFNLEPRLDVDDNGYYHLTLNEGSFQTLHRISGHIYEDGTPMENVKFNWESSHYWIIGDTLGYIIRRTISDEGRYVSLDTSYIVGFEGFEVPTINCCSYSNGEGEVNTMFGPVRIMKDDTVTVSVGYYDYDGQLQSEHINIVLE